MRIQDLVTYIGSLVPHTYYAYSFPTTKDGAMAVVSLGQGMPIDKDTGVARPSIQILVRGAVNDVLGAETKATEIFNALAGRENAMIGNKSVAQIQATCSLPFYIGEDENERPIFSMNFIAVVRP